MTGTATVCEPSLHTTTSRLQKKIQILKYNCDLLGVRVEGNCNELTSRLRGVAVLLI